MADLSAGILALAPRLQSSALLEPCQSPASDNPPWEQGRGRYLAVRLSPVRDTASSTGHLFLHRLLRSALGEEAFVDFAFFPSRSDRRVLASAGLPPLYGIFGLHGAEDYDALLISCSYALELVNLPRLLLDSGFPLRAGARQAPRRDGRPWPAVILGGSNALASQSLIFPDGDSFVDGIYFGEGEDGGPALVRALAASSGLPPGERALRMARVTDAFWAAGKPPGKSGRVRAARWRPGRTDPLLADRYPLLNTEEAGTARVQLSWGCPSFCGFCFEGWEHKPYRELPGERILQSARDLARNTGASTAELYSFNFNSHSDIAALILGLNRIFERVNMMSQRADLLWTVPGLLEAEFLAGKTSFTLGVEGISEGMRAYYSKGLSSDILFRLLERLLREKVRELKLFYILSGMETESDIAEFASFCGFLAGLRSDRASAARVLFSFGYLVRMPFTPLGGERPCLDRAFLESLAARLRSAVEGAGFEFRLSSDWEEYAVDQYLVLGPHETAFALEAAARAGCAYDQGVEGNLRIELEKALGTPGASDSPPGSASPFLGKKGEDRLRPLDFLDTAVSPAFLEARLRDARLRGDWGGCMSGLGDRPGSPAACRGCGACGTAEEREALLGHRILPAEEGLLEELGRIVRAKRRMRPRFLRARLPEGLSGAGRNFLGAWLLRAVLSRRGHLVGRLFRVEESLWSSPEWRERVGPGITGECVLALYGLGGGFPPDAPALSDADFLEACRALSEALGSDALGGDVLPVAPGTVPAVASASLRITLNRREEPSALLKRLRAWLSDLRLNTVERRTASGGRLFETAPKDRRKRILGSLELLGPGPGESLPMLVLEGGSKLDLGPLFRKPEDRALSRIRVERLDLS